MPQIFSIGGYVVYFWSDEGEPKEPVHVHVAQGRAQKNGTKIKTMGCNYRDDCTLRNDCLRDEPLYSDGNNHQEPRRNQ